MFAVTRKALICQPYLVVAHKFGCVKRFSMLVKKPISLTKLTQKYYKYLRMANSWAKNSTFFCPFAHFGCFDVSLSLRTPEDQKHSKKLHK